MRGFTPQNLIDMLSTGIKTPVGIKLRTDLNEIQAIGQQLEAILDDVDGTALFIQSGGRWTLCQI